jgi:hypothetical protein
MTEAVEGIDEDHASWWVPSPSACVVLSALEEGPARRRPR